MMIRNKKIIYSITILLLIVAVLFIWNSYEFEIGIYKRDKTLIKPPAFLDKTCGIENCHGLDIICGRNVPEYCTEIYAFGDRCREYASCEIADGKCQQAKSNKFDECKKCIEDCQKSFKNTDDKAWTCESECGNN